MLSGGYFGQTQDTGSSDGYGRWRKVWASWGYNCGEDVRREYLKTKINDTDTELAVQEWRNLSSFLALTSHYIDNPAQRSQAKLAE